MKDIHETDFFIRFDSNVTTKSFRVFYFEDLKYDFSEGLAFPQEQDGVYIFYKGGKLDAADTSCKLLYCGKTVDLRTRFAEHHKKQELSRVVQLYIAVSYCDNEKEITELETKLLYYYRFPENTIDNTGTHQTPTELSRH